MVFYFYYRINIVTGLKTRYGGTRSSFPLLSLLSKQKCRGLFNRHGQGQEIPLTIKLDSLPRLQASAVSWVGSGCIQDTPVVVVRAKATLFFEDWLS